MQCPRCGLQNPPGISACQRCGLAVVRAAPPNPSGHESETPPEQSPGPPSGPDYARPDAGQPSEGQQSQGQGGYPQSGSTYAGYGQYYPQQQSPQNYPPPGQSDPEPTAPLPYGQYAAPSGAAGSAYPGGPVAPYAPAGSAYPGGPVAPYGAQTGWPATATAEPADRHRSRFARLLLVVAVLASLGYAVWAMTARRGIFADFADNRPVSLDDAKTSDRLDTIFLVVAGALVLLALAVWLIRLMAGRARTGALTVAGFVLCGLGLVTVVVGLVLSGQVGNGGDRAAEGQDAVTATIVTGSGFIALALGLLIGLRVATPRRT